MTSESHDRDTNRDATIAAWTPGPAKVLVMARVVVPGDHAMPLRDFEACVAQALKDGGVLPVWVSAEFIDEAVDA
jgi:hypothetical protein